MSGAPHPAVAGAQPFMLAVRRPTESLFSDPEGAERLRAALSRYPDPRAALLPLLNYAQERNGWVSEGAMVEIAGALGVTPANVHSVVTFYTMYNRRPVGTHLIQVCTNISCHLNRAGEVFRRFLEETGTRPGEVSEDGRFTVVEVECLGACGFAPVVQINDEYHENVTPDSVPGVLEGLR